MYPSVPDKKVIISIVIDRILVGVFFVYFVYKQSTTNNK